MSVQAKSVSQDYDSDPVDQEDRYDIDETAFTLLIVDDEPAVLESLKTVFRKNGYRILTACSGRDSAAMKENRAFLGFILVKTGLVESKDYDLAIRERNSGETILESLIRLGVVSEFAIISALRSYLDLEFVDLEGMKLDPFTVKFLPRDLCEKNRLVPVRLGKHQLTLAMADPSDIHKCDSIALMTGLKINTVIARGSVILQKIEMIYGEPVAGAKLENEAADELDLLLDEKQPEVSVQQLIQSSEVPPVVRIVNLLLAEAIRLRASDIHLEPKTNQTVVRYRIDGLLDNRTTIPAELHPAMVSRIKVLAKIDIAERRKPQDGRITAEVGGRTIDIRVSSIPTINGEKIVLRILDRSTDIHKLIKDC